MLSQKLTDCIQTVLSLRYGTLYLTLAQLNLQQVVAVDSPNTDRVGHILLQLLQHVTNGSKRLQLLLQRHHLPIILLGGQLHLVC